MKSARKSVLFVVSIFIAALGAVFLVSQSPEAAEKIDKVEVQKIVREYLSEHPEIVIEAIESYQANQQEIEQRMFEKTLVSQKDTLFDDSLPFAGNPDADVVIAEFFDYNCGYCKRAVGDINKILDKDNNVKFIFHEMPILSNSSHEAARYSLASHKQGKYFEYHQALMKMSGSKTKASLEKEAEKIGLDVEQLRNDAASKEVREQVEKSVALSRKLGIRGTPAFVIGDRLAPGYMTYQNMQQIIEEVRKDGEG